MTLHSNSLVINVCVDRAEHQNSSNVTFKHITCIRNALRDVRALRWPVVWEFAFFTAVYVAVYALDKFVRFPREAKKFNEFEGRPLLVK